MTIYTSQNSQSHEKKEGELSQPLTVEVEISKEPEPISTVAPRRIYTRRRVCLQFLLMLLMIVGLSVCVFGSLYLWKWSRFQRYSGWCGVKYSTDGTSAFFLDENVEVDPQQSIEVLTVPEFDKNDAAVFVHDFGRNVSLIRVDNDDLCYFMPLDRSRIPEPTNFLSILFSLSEKRYLINADVVQQLYRVEHPSIPTEQVTELYGGYMGGLCSDFTSYTLIRLEGVEVSTTTTAMNPSFRRFGMFAGDVLINYEIIEIEF